MLGHGTYVKNLVEKLDSLLLYNDLISSHVFVYKIL